MGGLINRQRHRMRGKWRAWSAVESEKDRIGERERERDSGSRKSTGTGETGGGRDEQGLIGRRDD